MRLFRRRRGRHALGAAVTAIPSAPLAVPPPLPAQEAEAPLAPSVVVTPVAPELASEIAQLLASGEAWRSTTGGTASATPVPADTAPATPSVDLVSATPHVSVPAQSPATARGLLQAPLRELSTASSDAAGGEAPVPLRVQLGFRDGTSTVLDPSSTQAKALERLAESLSHRD